MPEEDTVRKIEANLDKEFFLNTLFHLIEVPTAVALGPDTLMQPDDPLLVQYVQSVVRRIMMDSGIYDVIEMPKNQIVAKSGLDVSGERLLMQVYTPTQHNNLMEEPWTPRVRSVSECGIHEPCIFGQGVSQNKVHMAAAITLLRAIVRSGVELRGLLYLGVNNEGRSSHACSEALLSELSPRPRNALILIGTGLDISLGNRGRVDVYVHVRGRAGHSSAPEEALSAIDGANEVINRLKELKLNRKHPALGKQHALAYQVVYSPVAPHTLPGYARITVDRRLLPGDDVDEAVLEIAQAIGDLAPYEVSVEKGVYMLPALVSEDEAVVQHLKQAYRSVRGNDPRTMYSKGTFDAGGLCALGIPTIMWGASGSSGLLDADFVRLSDAWDEVRILCNVVSRWLG